MAPRTTATAAPAGATAAPASETTTAATAAPAEEAAAEATAETAAAAEGAASTATPPPSDTVEQGVAHARALVDFLDWKVNDVVSGTPEEVGRFARDGFADPHPDAVAYARRLTAEKRAKALADSDDAPLE